jgi:predicted aspartyl protease
MKRIHFAILAGIVAWCSCASKSLKSDSPAPEFTIPFSLHDNRILINVEINRTGPFVFIFDTGGARSNTLTPEAAQRLGLQVTEGSTAHGAGNHAVRSGKAEVQQVSVGDLIKENQNFTILDLSRIRTAFSFPRLDGIIGFDVSRESIVCIDFDRKLLIFTSDASKCFPLNKAETIPFRIQGKTPIIQGSVDGISGELVIDTGDRSAFSLFQRFAKRSGLEKQFKGKPEVISGVGIGGPIPARISSIAEIRLGEKVQLKNVMTRLPSMKSGYFATDELLGSIGNEVLRRFNVVLDYPKKQLILVPNQHFEDRYKFSTPSTAQID